MVGWRVRDVMGKQWERKVREKGEGRGRDETGKKERKDRRKGKN